MNNYIVDIGRRYRGNTNRCCFLGLWYGFQDWYILKKTGLPV